MEIELLKRLRRRILVVHGKYNKQVLLVNWYGKVIRRIYLGRDTDEKEYVRLMIQEEVKRYESKIEKRRSN